MARGNWCLWQQVKVVDIRLLVRLLDRVHQRTALQRDTPAYGVDARVGRNHARCHRQLQVDHRRCLDPGIGAGLDGFAVDGRTFGPGRDPQLHRRRSRRR